MAAITWQVRLQMEVLESAKQHLQNAASEMTLDEAIQKAAQERFAKYSELSKKLSKVRSHMNWTVSSLSKLLSTQKKLTSEKAKELVSLRDESQNAFFSTEDEDEFVLVDNPESKMKRVLELLKSWEENPSKVYST